MQEVHVHVEIDTSELDRDVERILAGELSMPTVSAVRLAVRTCRRTTYSSEVVFLSCEEDVL